MKESKAFMVNWKEVIFQVILHFLVFIFYSFDRTEPDIKPYQIAFFLNSAVAAAVINYFLLPRFFYKKKYLVFFISVVVLIGLVMLMEEQVLEQIYFPDTRRAESFPGVFVTLIDILPVIVILSGFKFAWDAIVKQRQLEEMQAAIKESELQFLKSQINPHFLFNNLNNLYSYAISKSPKTPQIILHLSAVLRYMLYECKERYVPLSKEMEQLENFTKLYQLQIEERGKVYFTKKSTGDSHKIAPLILVVFIENAFKHSQASQTDNIKIEIEIELEGDLLKFLCRNNYTSIQTSGELSKGIGLKNVKKRLELLYPNAHELKIKESDGIFEVQLSMELQKLSSQ